MRVLSRILALLLPVLLLGSTGCGGGSSSGPVAMGALTLQLGADSVAGYSQVVVSLAKVEISKDGGSWSTLAVTPATFDLQALQNGGSQTLAADDQVQAGTYTQVRLTWGTTLNYQDNTRQPNYVVPTGGSGKVLTMPATTVAAGSVVVPGNGKVTARLMLRGNQAVQGNTTGATPSYLFLATGTVSDLAACASITGSLSAGGAALAGTEVYAETVDGNGLASITRRALSDSAGAYVLDALPAGTYFVAALPAGAGTTVYPAQAGSAVTAVAAQSYGVNLDFTATALQPGTIALTVTPGSTSTQGTWGELRQTLATGSGINQTLIVRALTATTTATGDVVDFTGLVSGSGGYYGVSAQRSTGSAAAVQKTDGSQREVTAGATTTVSISYP
ncbi:MAG: DUF4382 domain-containing protein [Holophaga sp.]|nr:DUF4382 domain-containing protein [Holophaga sp.]